MASTPTHGLPALRVMAIASLLVLAACRPVPHAPASPPVPPPAPRSDASSLLAVHGARPGLTLVALHDNENDAAAAARAFVNRHGGRLVEVRAQGTRHVAMTHGGQRVAFDPNRVFTASGVQEASASAGAPSDAALRAASQGFAQAVLDAVAIDAAPLLIAVHNNTDAAYSAASYAAGAPLARDAAALHLPPRADPDHFFLVTTRALFDALVPTGYPVVLQDNTRATDDGSLSILCARRGVAYVNVEAQHGAAAVQRAMLEALHRALAPSMNTPRR